MRHELLDRPNFAGSISGIWIAKEAIGCELHAIANTTSENFRNRNIPRLAKEVQTSKLESGEHLGSVVVEGSGGSGNEEAHLLETRRIVPDQVRRHGTEDRCCRFASTAHLAKADQAVVGFHFYDRADEAPPMDSVGMPERRFQGNRHSGRADVLDLHSERNNITSYRCKGRVSGGRQPQTSSFLRLQEAATRQNIVLYPLPPFARHSPSIREFRKS